MNGQKLRAFRDKRNIGQRAVGDAAGLSGQRISQIEHSENVSLEVAVRYLRAVEHIDAQRSGRPKLDLRAIVTFRASDRGAASFEDLYDLGFVVGGES